MCAKQLAETSCVPPHIAKAEWQDAIFAPRLKRRALMTCEPTWPMRKLQACVHRNTPFEYVAEAMRPFLAYADLEVAFSFGDYDDSLPSVAKGGEDADLHIIWLDFARYEERMSADEIADWISGRLDALRSTSTAPVLVGNWDDLSSEANKFNELLDSILDNRAGIRVVDRAALVRLLGARYRETRMSGIGATTLSGQAILETARLLGLTWIPAAIRPPIKALAVDFDNTLYSGVLGEDGPDGIVITPEHLALQNRLAKLAKEGFFLAAISKNEAQDVEDLLASAKFPLNRQDFSAFEVSWQPKSEGIRKIADSLRIGVDAIRLVDDNLGEISEVSAVHPLISAVHSADPSQTVAALTHGPDILHWTQDSETERRAADLAAARDRAAEMTASSDPKAYLRSLDTRLTFEAGRRDHVGRVHALSNKTNQFNLALQRFSEAQVSAFAEAQGPRMITVSLSDKLSESGIIAMLLLDVQDKTLILRELCVSCRALGRGLEDVMVVNALEHAVREHGCEQVQFCHDTGPRNSPARRWLADFVGPDTHLEDQGAVNMQWDRTLAERLAENVPVQLIWADASTATEGKQ